MFALRSPNSNSTLFSSAMSSFCSGRRCVGQQPVCRPSKCSCTSKRPSRGLRLPVHLVHAHKQQASDERACLQKLLTKVLAAAAAGLLCTSQPALADIQTVAPQDATSFARSLPKQRVNKGKVWLIFLAGAATLFGAAVALEKNGSLFPAIAKANQAMAATRAAQKKRQEEEDLIEVEQVSELQSTDAVLEGLAAARSNSQASSGSITSEAAAQEAEASISNGSGQPAAESVDKDRHPNSHNNSNKGPESDPESSTDLGSREGSIASGS